MELELVESRPSPIGGNGMFLSSSRLHRQGEKVLYELCQAFLPKRRTFSAKDIADLEFQIKDMSREDTDLFNRLHLFCEMGKFDALDKFLLNAFVIERFKNTVRLYLKLSVFNHSCLPNAQIFRTEDDGVRGVELLKDVNGGEEITIAYCNTELSYAARQSELRERWGFVCQCPKCLAEKAVLSARDEESRKRGLGSQSYH